MKTFYRVIFIGVLAPLVLGFFPALHPLCDSYSHFRIHLLLLLSLLLLLFTLFHKKRVYFFIVLLLTLGVLYWINQPYTPSKKVALATNTFKQMQFNLNFRNRRLDDVMAFIRQESPDIITMQEVTVAHEQKLQALNDLYAFQRYCDFYPYVGGVAILSKYPFADQEGECVEGRGLLTSKIDLNGTTLTVASVHLHWPYPYGQYEQFEFLKTTLNKMEAPSLVSGDFNAAPWSHIVTQIAKASNSSVVGGLRWTIALDHQLPMIPNMKLPIDQLLLSKGLVAQSVEVQQGLGSDHFPVMANIVYSQKKESK